jgi:hypothetical protein
MNGEADPDPELERSEGKGEAESIYVFQISCVSMEFPSTPDLKFCFHQKQSFCSCASVELYSVTSPDSLDIHN